VGEGIGIMSSVRVYPEALASWWRGEAAKHFRGLEDGKVPKFLVDAIEQLRQRFTDGRPRKFEDYSNSLATIMGYGWYYFPRSYVATRCVMDELIRAAGWLPAGERVRVLDVGAGTGAAGLAVLSALTEHGGRTAAEIELVAVDHSSGALRFATELTGDFFPRSKFRAVGSGVKEWVEKSAERDGFDLVVGSYVLNELPPDERSALVEGLIEHLRPGGILLLLEPGQPETAWGLAGLAHQLVASGKAKGILPWPEACTRADISQGIDRRYWPHEVRTWRASPEVEQLDRLLHHQEPELKFSFVGLGRADDARLRLKEAAGVFRLLSAPSLKPGHLLLRAADAEGQVWHLEWSMRGLRRSEVKEVAARYERGDLVLLPGLELLKLPQYGRISTLEGLVALKNATR
jgi:SAM-dependent methyltransferase